MNVMFSGVVVKIVLPRCLKEWERERCGFEMYGWCWQPRMFSHRRFLDFFRFWCKKLCVVGSKPEGLSQFIYSFILRLLARIKLLGRQPKNVLIGISTQLLLWVSNSEIKFRFIFELGPSKYPYTTEYVTLYWQ